MQRVLSLLALSLVFAPNAAQAACPLAPIGTAHVAAVRDGRTILLADGRVLRLAAIEITGKSREALAGLIGSRAAAARKARARARPLRPSGRLRLRR